jgi:hypothetical protein
MGTCLLCGLPVNVMACPCEIAVASDYLWSCSGEELNTGKKQCPNNTRPEHTGDQDHPSWVKMPE